MTRHQAGYIWRVGKSWYGRWYQDECEAGIDGVSRTVRRQHSEKLCQADDRYRSKNDVRPLLEAKLRPMNEGRSTPQSTMTVAEYGDRFFLPYAERELKPSTVQGYRDVWRIYVKPALGTLVLQNARCVDVTNMLTKVHVAHGISRVTLRHCKALLSSIFTHAKRAGVIDGLNPAQDAGLPHGAAKKNPTYAYTPEQVLAMLAALGGVEQAAIALMFFCGLRPGEARAARWDDLDLERRTLRIRASMWRKHVTAPKTEESIAPLPVAGVLAEILAELPRVSEYILAGPSGCSIDLHNLSARVIRPALAKCAVCQKAKDEHVETAHAFKPLPKWCGYYALRRGLATLATSVESQMAAKSLLRHSNIQTTAAHYIKSVPQEASRAMQKIDALFAADGVPN